MRSEPSSCVPPLAVNLLALLVVACSGGGSPGSPGAPGGAAGPTVEGAVQVRTFDPSGRTLEVVFSEEVVAEDAEEPTRYRVSGAVVTGATMAAPDVVRLTVDRVVVPGDRVLDVLPGIRGLSGRAAAGAEDVSIVSTDEVAPTAEEVVALTVSGPANDLVEVAFDDAMVAGDVEDVARWALESPLGSPVALDGAIVTYDEERRVAAVRLASANLVSGAGLAVALASVRDIGGNPLPPMSLGASPLVGRVGGDVTPPWLVSAAPGEAAGTLTLVFSEAVQFVETNDLAGGSAGPGTHIALVDVSAGGGAPLAALTSTATLDGLGALVTFGATPAALDLVAVAGVTDLAGNTLFPVDGHTLVARDVTPPALADGLSAAVAVSGERNDVLTVRFDRPMHPEAIDDDYRYGLLQGFFVDLGGARFEWNGSDEVTFHLEGPDDHDVEAGYEYLLAVANLRSAQGILIDDTTVDYAVVGAGDTTAPGLTSARLHPRDTTSIVVTFDEALRAASLTNAASYTLAGRVVAAVEALGPRSARVELTTAPTLGEVLEVAALGLVDLAGNAAAQSASIVVQAADAAPPSLAALTATAVAGEGGDLLSVGYSEQLEAASAVDPAHYTVTVDGEPLDLTGAELRYQSDSATVRIALPVGVDLPSGAPLLVSVSGVADTSGNVALGAALAAVVGGDTTPPASLAAFVNWRASSNGRVLEVRTDEALDASAATPLAWSAAGTVVQLVEVRSERHLRLTLAAPLAPTGTLTLTTPTDLAGNTAPGPLVVDPRE